MVLTPPWPSITAGRSCVNIEYNNGDLNIMQLLSFMGSVVFLCWTSCFVLFNQVAACVGPYACGQHLETENQER